MARTGSTGVFSARRERPMTRAMPEVHPDALEVSAEEERYLRGAFRRFALPYLLLVILITGGALALNTLALRGADADPPADELQSLVAEAASLREAIGGLREELVLQAASSGERLEQLEGGLAKLRAAAGQESSAELASRLDHAHQRITGLEGKLRQMQASTVAAPAPASPAWPVVDPGSRLP